MDRLKSINFKQGKYLLPAILYLPILFLAYFIINFFYVEKADVGNKMETTEYLNDKLPEANVKGDGIGDKYTNMLNSYGKIKDESAVENIDRDNEVAKEEYQSQYAEGELDNIGNGIAAAASPENTQRSHANGYGQQHSESGYYDHDQTMEDLRRALEEARNSGMNIMTSGEEEAYDNKRTYPKRNRHPDSDMDDEETYGNRQDKKTSSQSDIEESVKKHLTSSSYFNTISANESDSKLIKAIIDENITATDGSRVRLRLLDDIDVGERVIPRGTYLYCSMSGFGQQRVKGSVKSVMIGDEVVKVSLSLYDTDGLEGLYVPKSSFRDTANDIASSTVSQNINLNDGIGNSNSWSRWGMQALQNAYQKASNAISKNIRKNKVKIKYGTQVYLINSREIKNNN